MNILITNDDGVHAEGLAAMVEVAQEFGVVKVVAPDRERSACAHAMTLRDPLRVQNVSGLSVDAFSVNGFPVDCVNIGLEICFPDGCDLVLSGINHGPNLGFDVTYSGTVAGAMEGAINGIRSVAVSMALFVSGAPLHLSTGARWLKENWDFLVLSPWEPLSLLNVNVPAIHYAEIAGLRLTRMGRRIYEGRIEERVDPWGATYFWQGGTVVLDPTEPQSDVMAVSEGFVSISPITLDWTHERLIQAMHSRFTN